MKLRARSLSSCYFQQGTIALFIRHAIIRQYSVLGLSVPLNAPKLGLFNTPNAATYVQTVRHYRYRRHDVKLCVISSINICLLHCVASQFLCPYVSAIIALLAWWQRRDLNDHGLIQKSLHTASRHLCTWEGKAQANNNR